MPSVLLAIITMIILIVVVVVVVVVVAVTVASLRVIFHVKGLAPVCVAKGRYEKESSAKLRLWNLEFVTN